MLKKSLLNAWKVKKAWTYFRSWHVYVLWERFNRWSSLYLKATNNKHLKSYDPKEESKHIIHVDVNNWYGYAMSKFLPTNGFKWIDPEEFDLNKYTSNSSKECAL